MTDPYFDNPKLKPWQVFFGRLLLAVDQLVNVLLLGFPDETISGRCGRAMASGNAKWFVPALTALIDEMFYAWFLEKNHCKNSLEPEDRFTERRELWAWQKVSTKGPRCRK